MFDYTLYLGFYMKQCKHKNIVETTVKFRGHMLYQCTNIKCNALLVYGHIPIMRYLGIKELRKE